MCGIVGVIVGNGSGSGSWEWSWEFGGASVSGVMGVQRWGSGVREFGSSGVGVGSWELGVREWEFGSVGSRVLGVGPTKRGN
eukprot:7376440-Prymnesium_polylepis.1